MRKCSQLNLNSILHFGGFKETLDAVVDLMRSEYPCSVIMRGNPGSGKKTVIQEAERISGTRCIYINPFQCKEDSTAIRIIALKLDLSARLSMSELMDKIRNRPGKREKLVIVLEDFPEFCRKRQYLLYNLMNLLQASSIEMDTGPNITLIGLTIDVEWAEDIEKRVRSRLNAKCLELSLPYRDFEEYVAFTCQLLGGYEITEDSPFRSQLSYMYHFGNRSIRYLKCYLMSCCREDEGGKLVFDFDPESYIEDYQRNLNVYSKQRLKCLTRPQLDLLKLAVHQYHEEEKHNLTIAHLKVFAMNHKYKNLDIDDSKVLNDVEYLVTMGLLEVQKLDQGVGPDTRIYPRMTPREIKAVVDMDNTLRNIKTDLVWKRFR